MKVCQICFVSMHDNQFVRHMRMNHGVVSERKKYGSSDPLVRSVKRIRAHWRKTPLGRLRTLWESESKWRRKMTIARNKHQEVLRQIEKLTEELVAVMDKEKGQNQ